MKKLGKVLRASDEFHKLLVDIKIGKVKNGTWKGKRMLSDTRLTKAISRVPKLKDILLEANIEDEV